MNYNLNEPAYGHYSGYKQGIRPFDTIASSVSYLLSQAEALFGAADPTFNVAGVEYADVNEPPRVYFSQYSCKHIIIVLSNTSKLNLFCAFAELAHEVAHVLGPMSGVPTPLIEEGMATYFSREMCVGKRVPCAPLTPRYQQALDAFDKLMLLNSNAITKIRAENNGCLFKLKPADITRIVPSCCAQLATELCQPF